MPQQRIFDDAGETTVAIPFRPELVRRLSPEGIVRACMKAIVDSCRQIGARPIAGRSPDVLSEAEMRAVDPGAVLWRPGMVWIAIPVRRDAGESTVEARDLSPD